MSHLMFRGSWEAHDIPICLLLHDQHPLASRNKRLKYLLKVLADLLESPLDSLVFPLIKRLDQLLDTRRTRIELFTPLEVLVPLFRKVVVLLERLLIDVGKLL